MQLASKFTRTSAENSWKEFIEWIGFSTLLDALERKNRSLEDWAVFSSVTPHLFSIETGLTTALRKWRSTRKLWYPKEKTVYEAYEFVTSCTQLKSQLSAEQSRIFRRRVISEILPNGRLCHLQHEFRTAQNLLHFGWQITHFGFCGDPGPDFIARRNAIEVEIESKCLSPEIGLGLSYQFAARLMNRLDRELPSLYPNSFTTLTVEVHGAEKLTGGADTLVRLALDTYAKRCDLESSTVKMQITTSPLDDFLARFPKVDENKWVQTTFEALRNRRGDFGYFIRRPNELIFCNLIPMRPNQQAKKIMKLISSTCDRQFSKERPALLWLHLQGLSPERFADGKGEYIKYLAPFARHAFMNERRAHLRSIVFSGDTRMEHQQTLFQGNTARLAEASGRIQGFDNPRCRFGEVDVLAPVFTNTSQRTFY